MSVSKLQRKARPTNLDLQDQNFELHGCLEQTAEDVTLVKVQLAVISKSLGVTLPSADDVRAGILPAKIHRRLGGMRPWHVAVVAAPVITCAMAAYKVLEPALVAFAAALHRGLMTLH